jgi:pimeloyl-ACP methyl ester carboxylesterase
LAPFSKVVGSAASLVDRAFIAAVQARGRGKTDTISHAERLAFLRESGDAYEGVDDFFPAPRAHDIAIGRVRQGVWEANWPSVFEPYLPAVAERYLSRIENRTARARFYFATSPESRTTRPALIAVHGFSAGQWLLEENQWPVESWIRRGLDVVLPVLPFHAGRAGARRGPPSFPSADPRVTNEGFRQAVTDIRSLVRFLRDRGAPQVGLIGMSLGGYTSSLLATVTNEIDFVVPMIPLASIADFAREQGRLGTGPAGDEQHAELERANWIVSPFKRPLALPKTRALVIAAEFDRITGVGHATRIARHFDCEMMTMAGAHLLQLGRWDAFRAFAAMLERENVIEKRDGRAR